MCSMYPPPHVNAISQHGDGPRRAGGNTYMPPKLREENVWMEFVKASLSDVSGRNNEVS